MTRTQSITARVRLQIQKLHFAERVQLFNRRNVLSSTSFEVLRSRRRVATNPLCCLQFSFCVFVMIGFSPNLRVHACGASWIANNVTYQLADSGGATCTGCGNNVLTYEECQTATSTGTAALSIEAGLNERSSSGSLPPGCLVQDGLNFRYNDNPQGTGEAGHTPVCKVVSSSPRLHHPLEFH